MWSVKSRICVVSLIRIYLIELKLFCHEARFWVGRADAQWDWELILLWLTDKKLPASSILFSNQETHPPISSDSTTLLRAKSVGIEYFPEYFSVELLFL